MKFAISIFVLCLLTINGCNRETPAPTKKGRSVTTAQKEAQAPGVDSDVVKIVFVGQKQACDCTRTRIDNAWATLQNTLEGKHDIPVERIQRDVDEDEADKMNNMRPLMVAPGIYFFDVKENVVEMLQGEVTAEQVQKAIGG